MAEFFVLIIIACVALSVGAFGQAQKHGRDCDRLNCEDQSHDR